MVCRLHRVVQDDMPFRGLTKFGTAFLNRFEASILPCEILEKVIFVDTPGVLSGEKQRIGRSYDFVEVCSVGPACECMAPPVAGLARWA